MAAASEVLACAGLDADDVAYFAHGMTVGTNALLEERGARTGMLVTEGFADVIEIGRQARPDLYRLCQQKPGPLIPADLRKEIPERVTPFETLLPLNEDAARQALTELAEQEVESLAICLLFSFRDSSHERRLSELAKQLLPDAHVSTSHEVVGQFREFERFSTTCIDAYLSPLLGRYINSLSEKAKGTGLPEPVIMQSSGGVIDAESAARHGAWAVLSGPAGGAVGSAFIGRLSGYDDLLAIDMGGTSTDVCVVNEGAVKQTAQRTIGGRVLQLPMLDIHTVGAGGGSIAWADAGGALRVGPRSAGADPGPACYGSGGTEATVTDANLLLGYLACDSVLAGGIQLDLGAAQEAVGRLGDRLGLTPADCAAGIVRVANHEMLRALRLVTVERGVDPRAFALVAFGGAGPMHAATLAAELGITTVLCPRMAGVLSALGLVASDRRRDLARSVFLSGERLNGDQIASVVESLSSRARTEIGPSEIAASYDLRYHGQAFELTVAGSPRPNVQALREAFEKAHREHYGYIDPTGELELVTVRVAAIRPGAEPDLAWMKRDQVLSETEGLARAARFDGQYRDTRVVRGELAPGLELVGPAIIELPEATIVVPTRWRTRVDRWGSVVMEKTGT